MITVSLIDAYGYGVGTLRPWLFRAPIQHCWLGAYLGSVEVHRAALDDDPIEAADPAIFPLVRNFVNRTMTLRNFANTHAMNWHWLLKEPFLSVVGGGLAAAIVTAAFNVYWDIHKRRQDEEWQFKRYHANLIHISIVGLMESFFAAKSEMLYLATTLESLLANLTALSAQADAIVRQQGGPELTVAQLEGRKQQLLEPFKRFNQEQVNLRWNNYEQRAKENHSKAELHLTTLQTLVPVELYDEMVALFQRLSAAFPWNLEGAKAKLRTLEDASPEVLGARMKLIDVLETKLGRR